MKLYYTFSLNGVAKTIHANSLKEAYNELDDAPHLYQLSITHEDPNTTVNVNNRRSDIK